ncbi:MAG TPA: DUF2071 domain-containing protein [Flavisolibacter sp.]|nr:DUF2071 domain-containing protein [Flavisolibacter sp.]
MLAFLKNHPFAVEAHFEYSLVLTYAVPKSDLISLIPECLSVDNFDDHWGFVAIALVSTRVLRPKGFPRFLGNDFFLAGYRIFVNYHTSKGKRLRGLYILKSETDKKKMEFFGNMFTHYQYSTTDIHFQRRDDHILVESQNSHLNIDVALSESEINLPQSSPFHDWKEARRYAGPLPFTITYQQKTREILIIEGVREHWTPRPVEVIKANVGFMNHPQFSRAVLANAFVIENIPY